MMVLERTSWIWDAPSRNPPLEHMLVAVYVTMGAFLIWAARDPVRFLPLVSGAIHATTMAVDAWYTPGMVVQLAFRGDVIGTYIAPVTLALTHPRRFYLSQEKQRCEPGRPCCAILREVGDRRARRRDHAGTDARVRGGEPGCFRPADWICRGAPARAASANAD